MSDYNNGQISALPHDRTALERLLAQAEADALRKAVGLASTSINQGGMVKSLAFFLRAEDHAAYHKAVDEYAGKIATLIPKEGA